MTTSTTSEQATPAAPPNTGQEAKSDTKATATRRKPRVAPAKPKTSKKTTPAKKTPKAPKKPASAKSDGAREGSKTAKILDMLKRSEGATLKEIMKATGWQPHSVRGFVSGTLGKKMGLKVQSAKREDGQRVYSLPK